jgi:hypothetical protein
MELPLPEMEKTGREMGLWEILGTGLGLVELKIYMRRIKDGN